MMKYLLIFWVSLYISSLGYTQNLIRNASFENPSGGNAPNSEDDLGNSDNWLTAGSSSDWLKTDDDHYRVQESVNGTFVDIPAHTGVGYAGMFASEMIQQQMANPLHSIRHRMTMFIRISNRAMRFVRGNTPANTNPVILDEMPWAAGKTINLKVFTRVSRMQYDDDANSCNPSGPPNQSQEGSPINVATIPISLADFPSDQWHPLSFEFLVPVNNHEWIGFELDDCPGYFMIDDVTLEEIPCEECISCSPVDGCPDIKFDNYLPDDPHNETTPFTISGLRNVSFIKFVLRQSNGSTILKNIEFANPPDVVQWDGKDNNGNELPAGSYVFRLEWLNDCEARAVDSGLIKANSTGDETDPNTTTMTYAPIDKKTDFINDQCCESCLEINTLEDGIETPNFIFLESNITISAIDKLVLGPGIFIRENSNITFKAGQEILVQDVQENGLPAIFVENPNNTTIDYIIEACPKEISASPLLFLPEKDVLNYTPTILSSPAIINNTFINIYPNPVESLFSIQWNDKSIPATQTGKLIITDSNGQGFYRQTIQNGETVEIDINAQVAGIYFVLINVEEQINIQKIIKR